MLAYLLKLFFIAGLHLQQPAFQVVENKAGELIQLEHGPKKIDGEVLDVAISAESAIAVDAQSGQVLYQKDPNRELPIASITKLMTALVFLENQKDLDSEVTMLESDRHLGGILHFNIGEKISRRNLMHAMLVASDNDAAYLLARSSGMTVENFVLKMNEKARSLSMNSSFFVEPTGLDSKNVSSAADIVKLLSEASHNGFISEATQQKSYSFEVVGLDEKPRQVTVYTTDALAGSSYLQLLSGKTGYLQEAGYCLATKLKSQIKRDIYVVVLKSSTVTDRFQDVKAIEYYISKNYQ